jgi:hypothetical protein
VSISNIVGTELHDNGVYISSGYNSTVTGCSFTNVVGDGIQVRGSWINIYGNVLDNCDDFGIAITGLTSPGADSFGAGGSGYSVVGNTVRNCERGIRATSDDTLYPRDINISGNVVLNCTEAADAGCIEAHSDIGGIVICNNIVRTIAGDNGIFEPDIGNQATHIVI